MPRPAKPSPPVPSDRPRNAPVTLRQVAEAVGLSIASVSCAFNGKSKVSAANRERILSTAKALGYRPNLLVRAMQSGVSGNIGVVVSSTGEFSRALINGVCTQLSAAGIVPVLHWSRPSLLLDPEREAQAERVVLDKLLQHRVDGIILAPAYDEVLQHHFAEVWRRGLPLVSIDRVLPRVTCDSVSTDDVRGGRLAAEHLLSLGHRHVTQLAGELRYGSYARRAESFAATITAGGGTCRTIEVLNADHPQLVSIAKRLLEPPRPAAVFLGSDEFAPAVYQVADELGLTIPEQLTVLGYAGLEIGAWLQPPLSTMQQDPIAMGARAAELLIEAIRDPNLRAKPRRETHEPRLLLRGSTAAPVIQESRRG